MLEELAVSTKFCRYRHKELISVLSYHVGDYSSKMSKCPEMLLFCLPHFRKRQKILLAIICRG